MTKTATSEAVPKISYQKRKAKKRKIRVWSEDEDMVLLGLAKKYKQDWEKVAEELDQRNANQCLHRYRRIKGLKGGKSSWSEEDDARVLQLVG